MIQGGNDEDYSDTLHRYYGKTGWYLGIIAPVIIIYSPLIIYLIYLSQMLYTIVLAIDGWSTNKTFEIKEGTHFNEFSQTYCAIIMFFVMQMILIKRDFSFFMRVISIGSFFIILIIGFIIGNGFYSMSNTNYDVSVGSHPDTIESI